MILVGMTQGYADGKLAFAGDLADNIACGDATYLSLLGEADAYVARSGLDRPLEPEARRIGPDPACVIDPVRELDLAEAGISSIIWATGYPVDYSWLHLDVLDAAGKPKNHRGVSSEPGIYFLGLPWQTRRGSSFIWGSGTTRNISPTRIATQRKYLAYEAPSKHERQVA